MYDETTADLIRATPELPDLDRENLPDLLSRSYAEIVAARVRVREDEDARLDEIIDFGIRLAQTNEALVAVTPHRDNRAAAAFVAATAYQLVFQARQIAGEGREHAELNQQGIAESVAAMLLFLIGNASADAIEVSKHVRLPSEPKIERELVLALRFLARGQIQRILDRREVSKRAISADTDAEAAVSALYYTLLRAVRSLAESLLGASGADEAIGLCRQVQRLSQFTTADVDGAGLGPVSSFAGPFHLASLLLAVAGSLQGGAIVTVPSPSGTDPAKWQKALQDIARDRPYLWPNHLDAINRGLLNTGISAAVGFPTGAGKSTVSQLKIAAHLFGDRKVVFLAPTHALVDQTSRDLQNSFPRASIQGERLDEFGFDTDGDELPDILVMTPESCLALTHFEPDAFDDVGLLVFDECHLLHDKKDGSRRAIDAMLCVLNLVRLRPEADILLLSAMVKNVDELAGWLEKLTGRQALGLSLGWKPTRQLRGCVVYNAAELKALDTLLKSERAKKPTGGPPRAVKDQLKAQPFGFFSIKQTWASMDRNDYALLPFLEEAVALNTNAQWRPTPNANELSARLAARSAQSGLKTLVFSQSIVNAHSIARQTSEFSESDTIELNDTEKAYLETAIDEIGSSKQLYLAVKGEQVVVSSSVHHAQLLPEERRLVESLYKRRDGLKSLAATPTLGQGMNLPSEMVIIADDSRFVEAKGRKEVLEAQDQLERSHNFLRHAGRRREFTTSSCVLRQIVGRPRKRNSGLNSAFDPGFIILHFAVSRERTCDRARKSDILCRLVVNFSRLRQPRNHITFGISKFLGLRVNPIEQRRQRIVDDEALIRLTEYLSQSGPPSTDCPFSIVERDDFAWDYHHNTVCILTCTPCASRCIQESLDAAPPDLRANINSWRDWMMDWIEAHPASLERLLKSDDLESQFGKPYKDLETPAERCRYAVPLLRLLLEAWMSGKTLNEMQALLPPNSRQESFSTGARKFVTKLVPSLAYFFSVPALIYRSKAVASGVEDYEPPPSVALLSNCVRRGYDCVEKAAVATHYRSRLARRALHRQFAVARPYLDDVSENESWKDVLDRVERAMDKELNNRKWDLDDLI